MNHQQYILFIVAPGFNFNIIPVSSLKLWAIILSIVMHFCAHPIYIQPHYIHIFIQAEHESIIIGGGLREKSVAHRFSKETGLLWTMKPEYYNPFH